MSAGNMAAPHTLYPPNGSEWRQHMSDYDRNLREPGLQSRLPPPGWSSTSWIAGAVIAVLLLVAIGYVFSNRTTSNSGMVEHRAASDTTDTTSPKSTATPPAPAAVPATPDNAKKP